MAVGTTFLLEHNWTVNNYTDLKAKLYTFEKRYPLYDQAEAWFQDLFSSVVPHKGHHSVDFNTASNIATLVGEQYFKLNDRECADMPESCHIQ